MKSHRRKRPDGVEVTIVTPPLSCRHCDGDGRQWDGRRFIDSPCERCDGSGDDPTPTPTL